MRGKSRKESEEELGRKRRASVLIGHYQECEEQAEKV